MQKRVTKELLDKWLKEAESDRDLHMIALHDMLFGKIDLEVKIRDDVYHELHEITFSRLHINGVVVDVNKDTYDYQVYWFTAIESGDGYFYLPNYLKTAIWKAKEKRAAIFGPLVNEGIPV